MTKKDPLEPTIEMVDTVRRYDLTIDARVAQLPPKEQVAALREAGIDLRELTLAVFDAAVTEETTDVAIDFLVDAIPTFGLGPIFKKLLDMAFPKYLRGALERLLYGW